MRAALRFYQYVNILSLDIAAGAVISAQFFAKIFDVQVKPYGLIALALTVWIIYTVDHLRDAKNIKHKASTQRHRFHQKYFRPLIIALGLAIAVDTFTLFFIRRQVFEWGLILLVVVILYLIIQQYLRFLKEFFIASLYTCGVLLISITITTVDVNMMHVLLIVQFGMIAWTNLVLFSWFDHVYDAQDKQNSFVTIMGKRATGFFLYGLFGVAFLITVVQVISFPTSAPVMILCCMNMILFLIFIFRNSLARYDLYRLIGDAVFLIPAFLLISQP
jgi:hypothetical protein